MEQSNSIPVAQYLRKSTDDQAYSIERQATSISDFCAGHNFTVVKTYIDSNRTGLLLASRPGLSELLSDVLGGRATFAAVLVYDVSRWGRFQDIDESGYYEFLCKKAGVQVHYCAEPFETDLSPLSAITKAIKRTLAAEYSRELGERVFAGQRRLVNSGYRMGSCAGYGLRRMLIQADGSYRQVLQFGDRKSLCSDHVTLVPGPADEVDVVRRIFTDSMKHGAHLIARQLNEEAVPYQNGKPWDSAIVSGILRNPKYAGFLVWGKTSKRLGGQTQAKPSTDWIVRERFPSIVDPALFDAVQRARKARTKQDPQLLLNHIAKILDKHGHLTKQLILRATGLRARSQFYRQLGGIEGIYKRLGQPPPDHLQQFNRSVLKMGKLRRRLIGQLLNLYPGKLAVVRSGRQKRETLQLATGQRFSIISARLDTSFRGAPRWNLFTVTKERDIPVLLCISDILMNRFTRYYLLPRLPEGKHLVYRPGLSWVLAGRKLNNLSEFYDAVQSLCANSPPPSAQ